MKQYLKKLVFLIALAGTLGPAWALDHTINLGTASTSANTQAEFYTAPSFLIPYSFSDMLNFTIDSHFNLARISVVGLTPVDDGAGLMHDSNLSLTLFGGSNGSGAVKDSATSAGGAMIGLSDTLSAGTYSIGVTGSADGKIGGGYLFSIAAIPEPGDWMLLLGGLVVGVYIVRRSRYWAGTGGLTISDHIAA